MRTLAFVVLALTLSVTTLFVGRTSRVHQTTLEPYVAPGKPEVFFGTVTGTRDLADFSVPEREPILGALHDVEPPEHQEEAELRDLQERLKVLEDENNRLKELLQLCRSSPEATPLGVFLRLPEAGSANEETIAWLKLVSEFYPIPLTDGEAIALAEQKSLLTSDESWHQGVIDTLGVQRIIGAMENWTPSQREKLAGDVNDGEAILLGLGLNR